MNASADVSVVIPVRDGAPLLELALRSVEAQAIRPREIIVVDDHSSDGLDAVVARFHGVTLLRSAGEGAAEARNLGAQHASMPYLAFLDADDLWPAARTGQQLRFLRDNPLIDLVSGSVVQFRCDASGAFVPLSPAMPTRLPSASLVRRDAFLRVGFFSAQWQVGETIEWWSRAVDSGLGCASIDDIVLYRRVHDNNLGRTVDQPGRAYLDMLHGVIKRRRDSGLL